MPRGREKWPIHHSLVDFRTGKRACLIFIHHSSAIIRPSSIYPSISINYHARAIYLPSVRVSIYAAVPELNGVNISDEDICNRTANQPATCLPNFCLPNRKGSLGSCGTLKCGCIKIRKVDPKSTGHNRGAIANGANSP